jgi:hypothetical protein
MKLNIINRQRQYSETQIIRNFNKYSITELKVKLSYDSWDNIFVKNEVNIIFSNFLDKYLRILLF